MRNHLMGATLLGAATAAAVLGLSLSAANAGLITAGANGTLGSVTPTSETQSAGLPGIPLVSSFLNGSLTVTGSVANPETYEFQFWGGGNAANTNTFTSGGHTITSLPLGGDGGTLGTTNGVTGSPFFETFTANTTLSFSFTSSGGCSISSGSTSTSACAYVTQTLGSIPNTVAFIGLTDSPYPADSDFQDLTIRVSEVPEPASLTLLGSALLGMAFRFRRKARKLGRNS